MMWIANGLTGIVVALALASLLLMLARRHKSAADIVFAVFCGSLAMAMLRQGLEAPPAWLALGLAVGGCATCNAYWLLARALFRGPGGIGRAQVAVALGIAVLIVGYRLARIGGLASGWLAVVGSLLTLASSTVLVLAFIEALRDWSPALSRSEKRLRLGFMGVYGGCVLAASIAAAWMDADPAWQVPYRIVVTSCALAILVFTHVALLLRRHAPLVPADPAAEAKPEDRRLAKAILRQFEEHAIHLQPELKVADLARRVGSAEHKVSRVITQVLGERNFNQLVNRYRITHACRLLETDTSRSVLDISAEAGFASLGPFNRAFKTAMGCTPTAWRATRQAASAASDGERQPTQGPASSAGAWAPDV